MTVLGQVQSAVHVSYDESTFIAPKYKMSIGNISFFHNPRPSLYPTHHSQKVGAFKRFSKRTTGN